MRLDSTIAPAAAVGLGLYAVALCPQNGVVEGFSLTSGGIFVRGTPRSFFVTNNDIISPRPNEILIKSRLLAQPSGDDVIDAVVEEKSAGLALGDEENTSVRTPTVDVQ